MPRGRKRLVVDTNVLIVANRRGGESYKCAAACARFISDIRAKGTVVLDEGGEILQEYSRYLNYKGAPGAGDAFLRWFINNRGRSELCTHVAITPITHEWRMYAEFPDNPKLQTFDRADQKFVAVSCIHTPPLKIGQAGDSKWLGWEEGLAEAGVTVDFLCRDELTENL